MVLSALVVLLYGRTGRLMMNHMSLLMGDDVCLPPPQTEKARIHYSDVVPRVIEYRCRRNNTCISDSLCRAICVVLKQRLKRLDLDLGDMLD